MDPILASIQLFAFNFAPLNWMVCDGSLVPISQHAAVFSLVGTTYGGDGMTNFGLPNLKGKEPVPGSVFCICMQGIFPQRP
ncbi:phage tail protein [Variovorax sp. dw_308]|uniref:phage tail protein n=1 Tax=Variovorax sp. dw_308 TaxID=2721546 RepID=UPI001C484E31|nr:tail fiber protein [Variovorax sp. dw_308]